MSLSIPFPFWVAAEQKGGQGWGWYIASLPSLGMDNSPSLTFCLWYSHIVLKRDIKLQLTTQYRICNKLIDPCSWISTCVLISCLPSLVYSCERCAWCGFLQEVKDKSCSRSLEKFTRALKDALQKLRTPLASDDGADTSTMFDSPTVVADSPQVC